MKLPDRVITWAAILTAAFLAARLLFPGQHTDALETALADQRAVNVRAEARNTRSLAHIALLDDSLAKERAARVRATQRAQAAERTAEASERRLTALLGALPGDLPAACQPWADALTEAQTALQARQSACAAKDGQIASYQRDSALQAEVRDSLTTSNGTLWTALAASDTLLGDSREALHRAHWVDLGLFELPRKWVEAIVALGMLVLGLSL